MYEPRPPAPHRRRTVVPVVRAPTIAVRGFVSVRFLDGDGRTPILVDAIDRHGEIRRVHELAERPNLFTNGGMDALHDTAQSLLRATLRVGTGTAPPAFGDTTLEAEAQNGTTVGTATGPGTTTTEEVWTNRNNLARRIVMTADRNLTEFGFGTPSVLSVRNLFRDEFGDPVTVSLLTDKIIEVVHRLETDFPRYGLGSALDWQERDAANNVTSTTTVDINAGFAAHSTQSMEPILIRGSAFTVGVYGSGLAPSTAAPANAIHLGGAPGRVADPYVTGSYQWETSGGTLPVTTGNQTWFGGFMGVRNHSNNRWRGGLGYFFQDPVTDDPVGFPKLSTHTLTLPTLRISWARA